METVLDRFANPDADPVGLLASLIGTVRPDRATDTGLARRNLQALCHLLNSRPEWRRNVRQALYALSRQSRHAELYTSTGILPNTGFFSELFRRIGHTILPEVLDSDLLRSAIRTIFNKPGDSRWTIEVGIDV